VKCRNASIECFEIPLLHPLHIKGNELLSRRGAYLVLVDELGHQAMGECSPLPGFSTESYAQAHAQLQGLASQLIGRMLLEPGRTDETDELDSLFPSVRMALDMAIMDLGWQRSGRLSDSANESVTLNGLVMGQDKEAAASVVALLEQGYRSIKIKVARQSLTQDVVDVMQIRRLVEGRARLRLDANRSWSLDQACDFARALGPEFIDYIEEPTQRTQDHCAFWQATRMRVALDESICQGVVPDELLGEWIGAFVLKPAMIGNLSQVEGLIDRAGQLDIPAVLSSVFESPVALQFYARLAFVHGLQHEDHGLDTWRWLRPGPEGLPFEIRQGSLIL
jgi:o-succinylbenzoate synthase